MVLRFAAPVWLKLEPEKVDVSFVENNSQVPFGPTVKEGGFPDLEERERGERTEGIPDRRGEKRGSTDRVLGEGLFGNQHRGP